MQSHFSYHAFIRTKDRISIPHEQLAEILDDEDLNINIGNEKNTNRVHKLFYSEIDNMCFVAVQDCKTGTVITILPIDYHENIAWLVPIELQIEAKRLILKEEYIPVQAAELPAKNYTKETKPQVFKVAATVVNEYGEYVCNMQLGSWQSGPYGQSIDALVSDKHFVNSLKRIIKEKVTCAEQMKQFVQTICIKLGKKGDYVFYDKSELLPVGV